MTQRVNSGGMKDLSDLTKNAKLMRESTDKLEQGMVDARIDGWPWGEIAAAAGMTRQGVEKIAKRRNGGRLPQPRQRTATPAETTAA